MAVGIHLAMVCIICGNCAAGNKFGLVRQCVLKQGRKTLLAVDVSSWFCAGYAFEICNNNQGALACLCRATFTSNGKCLRSSINKSVL